MMHASSSSPPPSAPPPSPEIDPPTLHGPTPTPTPLQRRAKRAVFEIASTSPQAFTSEEESVLKERLERARKVGIAVKPGVPARLLPEKEMEDSSSSGLDRGQAKTDGVEAEGKIWGKGGDSSPWATDSETSSRRVSSRVVIERKKKSTGGSQDGKRGGGKPRGGAIRVEGFEIRDAQIPSSSHPPPSPSRPLRRPALCSTSSLSRLFACPPSSMPAESSDTALLDLPLPQPGTPSRNWNADIFGAALAAENRAATPTAPPMVPKCEGKARSRSTTVSSSSTLTKSNTSLSTSSSRSTLATASRRPHFLSPSPSLVSTPNHSPPRSPVKPNNEKDLNLQFVRRPGFNRQGSAGESMSRLYSGRGEKETSSRGKSREISESDGTDTEVEQSESEESELSSLFQSSVFASNYSNSATTLSSTSTKTRKSGSTTSEPTFAPVQDLAATVPGSPTPHVAQTMDSNQRRASEPQKVNLGSLRRQQLERKEAASKSSSESTVRRQRGVDLASPPWEFKGFGKLFSRR